MKKRTKPEPGRKAREVLAENLTELMRLHPDLDSQEKIGERAGLAPRSVGYMVQPTKGNPTIDNIAKVAAVFKLETWQILARGIPVRVLSQEDAVMLDAIRRYGKPHRE